MVPVRLLVAAMFGYSVSTMLEGRDLRCGLDGLLLLWLCFHSLLPSSFHKKLHVSRKKFR